MLGYLKQGWTLGWGLETGPDQIQTLIIMLSRIRSVMTEEGLGHVIQDELENGILVICDGERRSLKHQDEEIDSDVEDLCLLRVVLIPCEDFRSHVLGGARDFTQRNSDPRCMPKVYQFGDAVS